MVQDEFQVLGSGWVNFTHPVNLPAFIYSVSLPDAVLDVFAVSEETRDPSVIVPDEIQKVYWVVDAQREWDVAYLSTEKQWCRHLPEVADTVSDKDVPERFDYIGESHIVTCSVEVPLSLTDSRWGSDRYGWFEDNPDGRDKPVAYFVASEEDRELNVCRVTTEEVVLEWLGEVPDEFRRELP